MGLFDQIAGQVMGGNQQAANPAASLVGPIAQLLAGGGLSSIVSQLSANGLGSAVASWVSTGQNQPVTGQQLQSALAGSNLVGQLTAKTGLSGDALHGLLAQVLPQVVDHMTPGGSLPAADAPAPDLGALVGKLFG